MTKMTNWISRRGVMVITTIPTAIMIVMVAIIAMSAIPTLSSTALAIDNVRIPAEVESQVQALEERFQLVLSQECPASICSLVGCEPLRFRTLDQAQNSSLPGLETDEGSTTETPQFKLEAARCEFAYEPTLPADALVSLRQRLNMKVRQASVALTVMGRRLNPANGALKTQIAPPTAESGLATPPDLNGSRTGLQEFWSAIRPAVSPVVLIVFSVLGLLALIWGFRRLGRTRSAAVDAATNAATATTATAAAKKGAGATAAAPVSAGAESASPTSSAAPAPSAFMIMTKKEQLAELLNGSPEIAEAALKPLITGRDVNEICLFLRHFGPQPLGRFAEQDEHRDLFEQVRKAYESRDRHESTEETWAFLERLERRVALAQLGRRDSSVEEEFSFLGDLAPDEFTLLAKDLSDEELMTVLSFLPAGLRTKFLRDNPEEKTEKYLQHVLRYPRIPDQWVRGVARRLRELYAEKRTEIRNVTQEQLPILEQLLNASAPKTRERLVQRLKNEQTALFERLVSSIVLDRSVPHLSEGALNEVFLSLSPEEAAAYLDAHPDRQEILKKLKPALASSIRSHSRAPLSGLGKKSGGTTVKAGESFGLDLEFLESDDGDAESARRKVMDAIKAKSAAGLVDLRSLNEKAMDAG